MPVEKRNTGVAAVDRAIRPIRRAVNELTTGVKGLTDGVNSLQKANAIKFKHIATIDGAPTGDGIVLTTGDIIKIKHQLGQKLQGWIVTDVRDTTAAYRIERVQNDGASDANDNEDLWLSVAGSNVTIRLLVY